MNVWDINTIIPYMKEFDIPYVPDQWEKYRRLYPTEKNIFGRYYALMRLRGYREYGFNDTFQFIDAMVKKTND